MITSGMCLIHDYGDALGRSKMNVKLVIKCYLIHDNGDTGAGLEERLISHVKSAHKLQKFTREHTQPYGGALDIAQ